MAKKRGAHDCVEKVNEQLAKQGDRLQHFITVGKSVGDKIAVATERIKTTNWKRGSSWLLATYCPFCGVDLRRESPTPSEEPK